MQLVLSGIFHVDVAPAPFDLERIRPVLEHRLVRAWVPLALGDSLQGYRVAGTEPAGFASLYGGTLSAGAWPARAAGAVLGAEVAQATGHRVGDTFVTTHGLSASGHAHEDYRYEVTGVLARTGTVLDTLVVTPIASVWEAHATPGSPGLAAQSVAGKASMVLVSLRSPLGNVMLPRLFASAGAFQVAVPARETAKLHALIRLGADATLILGAILLACAALAVCAGLLSGARERMRDIAVLRLLGASRGVSAAIVLLEATFIGGVGGLLGLSLGHAMVELAGRQMPLGGPAITGFVVEPAEGWILAGAILVSWVGAALPAWRAQRAVVPDVLNTR